MLTKRKKINKQSNIFVHLFEIFDKKFESEIKKSFTFTWNN